MSIAEAAAVVRNIALRVTPEAERAIRGGHPWLFENSIREQSQAGQAGDLAVIFDRKGRFLAVGLLDPESTVRVRILQRGKSAAIDESWFKERIQAAAAIRAPLTAQQAGWETTGYRLVHGENDGLPGLVVDRYDRTLVLKVYTAAWLPHLSDVLAALAAVQASERVVLRLGRGCAGQASEGWGLSDGAVLAGPPLEGPLLFRENGLEFEADVVHGQKTGFFFDQRDNRARVQKQAKGKSVLNLFAYTGGFSVYAARGGARSVLSLDSSAPALEAAQRNWERNKASYLPGARHEVLATDAFAQLERMKEGGRRFGLVIVDPPAFAQEQSQVKQALKAYERLSMMSLAVLAPGGTWVMASCSSRVDADTFFGTVLQAAQRAGRRVTELERSRHALDHPIGFREGAYLKCLFARVA
ncbi:MAG TPA: class I SAM-dependent rRNA methyltransferase [Anaerolineae bacterium]|nr:class I SAM-dependent rRNA methyltransferase [Anaerolineae bacterium]